MEAASATLELGARRRMDRFERECERLRPLGEAFVLRRFGGSLGRADAEDAVAEVLIRLHRQIAAGRAPRNLRAAFFTGVRNAAIDILRTRAAKPTVALEAAAAVPSPAEAPTERAESSEDAVRLQEALGRMRGNYREAILLRFGLGLTVPEMAEQLGISLPAAKKLVLRSTRQVRQRLEAIEGHEFCPEMRALARSSVFEKRVGGLASEAESEVLRSHFSHCGPCRSFLAGLHDAMHDLGAAAVLGLTTAAPAAGRIALLERLLRWPLAAHGGARATTAKLRHLACKATAAFSGPDAGSAGALVGTGQKIAAICGVGATATATCLLTGAVGPGIGVSAPPPQPSHRPPASLRAAAEAPQPPSALPSVSPSRPEEAPREAPPPIAHGPRPSHAPTPPAEFGVESGPSPPSTQSAPSPPASTTPPAASSRGELGVGSAAGAPARSGSGSGGSVGFQG